MLADIDDYAWERFRLCAQYVEVLPPYMSHQTRSSIVVHRSVYEKMCTRQSPKLWFPQLKHLTVHRLQDFRFQNLLQYRTARQINKNLIKSLDVRHDTSTQRLLTTHLDNRLTQPQIGGLRTITLACNASFLDWLTAFLLRNPNGHQIETINLVVDPTILRFLYVTPFALQRLCLARALRQLRLKQICLDQSLQDAAPLDFPCLELLELESPQALLFLASVVSPSLEDLTVTVMNLPPITNLFAKKVVLLLQDKDIISKLRHLRILSGEHLADWAVLVRGAPCKPRCDSNLSAIATDDQDFGLFFISRSAEILAVIVSNSPDKLETLELGFPINYWAAFLAYQGLQFMNLQDTRYADHHAALVPPLVLTTTQQLVDLGPGLLHLLQMMPALRVLKFRKCFCTQHGVTRQSITQEHIVDLLDYVPNLDVDTFMSSI